MAAGQRPAAVVHPQLLDAPVEPLVGNGRDWKTDPSTLTVQVENHFVKAVSLSGDAVNVLDQDVAPPEPGVQFDDERLERPPAPDASTYRVMQFELAGERSDQLVELPGHETVPERHVDELALTPLLQSRQHRRREQLGGPRHPVSVPH